MTSIEDRLVLSELQEEMAVWWTRNKATISGLRSRLLSKHFESELEYRSGNNPLLLRGVIESLEGRKETETESDFEAILWFETALQRREAQNLDTGISWVRARIGIRGKEFADQDATFHSSRGAIAGQDGQPRKEA